MTVAAVVAAQALVACQKGATVGRHGPAPAPVKVEAARMRAVNDTSTYVGTARSRRSVFLQPQVAGQVARIFVKYGDEVASGAALIELDPRKQAASVNSLVAYAESARSERDNAVETLKALEATRLSKVANVRFAEQQCRRYKLLQEEGAVSQENVDQYETQLKVAQSELTATEAQMSAQRALVAKCDKIIRQSKASVKEQEEQLGYFTVVAPFAGTVGDIPVRIGEYVTTESKLTSVTQNRPLEIEIAVPAQQAGRLRTGMSVDLLDMEERPIGQAGVFFVAPRVNDENQTITIKALYDNNEARLRSGQFVTARIIWSRASRVVVPTTAVSHLSGQSFVFVLEKQGADDFVVRQRPVELGEIDGDSYVVISGLKSGEPVVVAGVQALSDGLPVSPRS